MHSYMIEGLEKRQLLSTVDSGILDIGNAGGDTIILVALNGADVNVTTNGTVETFPAAGITGILIHGGPGNDLITVQVDLPTTVHGGLGNDRIQTAGGNDLIYGGEGNDIIHAGAGDDAVYGKDGTDRIWGDDGNDLLYGQGKSDTVYGGTGNDTIFGGAGSDQLLGGDGDDRINFQANLGTWQQPSNSGHVLMRGGAGADVLVGDSGDTILGEAGPDTFVNTNMFVGGLNSDFNMNEDVLA